MATNEEMLVSAFQEKAAIVKRPFLILYYLLNSRNVMSHTRMTHDKFHTKKSKMAASRPFYFYYLGNLA